MKPLKIFLLIVAVLSPHLLLAQEDTLFFQYLEEAYVTELKNTSMLNSNTIESVSFNVESLDKFPKLFGQSDPIRFVQSLPSVQTASAMDPGVNVLGCKNSQNEFFLAGAPFYPSPRLLGLFPTINTDAFSEIKFKPTADGNFLGGHLSWDVPDSLVTKTHVNASLGLISAQGTVNFPMGKSVDATISARKSYLNLLYGDVLKVDGGALKYGFWDANATVKWKIDKKNLLDATVFYSSDKSNINYWSMTVDGGWSEKMAVARLRHKGDVKQTHSIYASDAQKKFVMDQVSSTGYIKTYKREIGYRGDILCPLEIRVRPELTFYENLPQDIYMDSDYKSKQDSQEKQKSLLAGVIVDRIFEIGDFSLTPKVTLNYYKEFGYSNNYFHVDPAVIVEYNMYDKGKLSLDFGTKHQYFTELTGFPAAVPIQFWIADGHYTEPQESCYATLSYSLKFGHGMWGISSQLYYKNVRNQLEFNGFYLTMALTNYKLEDYLLKTKGYNYGANVMFSKNSGKLTGWVSYSFGRAIRSTDMVGFPATFPASYERPHEFNIMASYKLGQFDFSASYVLASGTPYTCIKNIYFYQDMLLSEFYDYNSSRLAPYMKLDISATWNFKSNGKFDHGVNLSVYNATATDNEIGYWLTLDSTTGEFQYRTSSLIISVIPSISYFIKF